MTKRWHWIGLVAFLLFCSVQAGFAQATTFRGEYFNNMALAGAPVLVRDDANINFSWGTGSPGANVPADNFSVRWTGALSTNGGPYRFTTWTDDGVRLWVNNILILDRWFDQQAAPFSADLDLPAGAVPIRMEYYENVGGASAKLYWEPTPTSPNPVGPWRGEYFNNTALSGSPSLVRNDAVLNFDWGSGSPGSGVQADRFSVRWTNSVTLTAGRYRFTTTTDDGVRLWVNNNLVLDKWFDQVAVWTVEIDLPAGTLPIRMEYYDNLGNAVAKLTWYRVSTSPPPPSNLWRGEYFANTGLAGAPVMVRDDSAIDFNWGGGSPGGAVPADNFSVRWTRNVSFEAGRYRFTAVVDDGVRLWVNDRLIIDKWFDQATTTYTAEIDLAAGAYPVKLEYYERGGGAVIRMGWDRVGSPPPPPPPPGTWRGEYFGNLTLSGSPAHVRMDAAINFNWGMGSPVPSIIDVDNFSVRWTQSVNLAAGRYRFTTRTDDGVRLWVNNRQIIDKWYDQSATSHSAEIDLPGGAVPIRMEYYERGGEAIAVLNWTLLGGTPPPPPPPVANWRGEYYANRTLSGSPAVVRSDAEINFVWAYGSPGSGLPADNFSVRWTQSVYFNQGRYRFTVRADDGVRLWVNSRLVIDLWYDQNGETSVEIDLPSGQIPIKMEYYEHAHWAEARLKWLQTASPWQAP